MRAAPVLLLPLAACEPELPCDQYVGYMCDCHHRSDVVACNDLEKRYQGADAVIQEQCATLLDQQERVDEQAGSECRQNTSSTDDWMSSSS